MEFHFFGLTLEYRLALFNQIHEIVFYGKGGYDFDTVYNFPIWLRRFIYKSIETHYEKEAEQLEESSKGTIIGREKKPNIPKEAFQKKPDYTIRRPASK